MDDDLDDTTAFALFGFSMDMLAHTHAVFCSFVFDARGLNSCIFQITLYLFVFMLTSMACNEFFFKPVLCILFLNDDNALLFYKLVPLYVLYCITCNPDDGLLPCPPAYTAFCVQDIF